jgi:type I restriction enzyme S subunit
MSSKTKTTATKEEATPALVPKLRFPEFRDDSAWEQKEVGEVFQVTRGDVLSMTLVRDEKTEATPYPVYSSQTKNNGLSGFYSEYLFADAITWTTDGANAGDVNYRTGKFFCTNVCGVLLSSKGFANSCIAALINSVARKYVSYVGNPKLMNGVMSKIPIPVPSLPEQQKISECLSSVDEMIAAQARKLDALKTHKKGLMQQLFPREGETQPRLRFPEFQNAGEWVEVALGDIAEIKLGKMLDKQKHTTGHLLPYLNNLAVRWNEVNTSDLPKMYFNDRELDRFGLRAGDVVVCEGGEPGRAAVWDGRLPDLKFQKAIHRVRFKVPFEPKILVLHLENLAGTDQFEMLFTGGGIKHLTGETFTRLKIPLIPHAEQQRIADCLSSLDDLIAAQTQKHEALKTHKKGLMQQLFPSPEEVAV